MKKLSILIPSIESRAAMVSALLVSLDKQGGGFKNLRFNSMDSCRILILDYMNHEVIVAVDNKEITTGAKRNILLHLASYDYVVMIDDDDKVPDYYVEEFIKAIQSDADCIAINGVYTCDGKNPIKWYLSKNNDNVNTSKNGKPVYLRTTNHITAVKRELALLAMFPNKSNAEDKSFSEALRPHLKTEHTIHSEMYHYDYSSKNKEYK
jgi:hypothetical protein